MPIPVPIPFDRLDHAREAVQDGQPDLAGGPEYLAESQAHSLIAIAEALRDIAQVLRGV